VAKLLPYGLWRTLSIQIITSNRKNIPIQRALLTFKVASVGSPGQCEQPYSNICIISLAEEP
jgi:hypothetical protein